jgi:hypothetical protein
MSDLQNHANLVRLEQYQQSIETFTFWAVKDFTTPQYFTAQLMTPPTCNGYQSVTYAIQVTTASSLALTVLDPSSFLTCI